MPDAPINKWWDVQALYSEAKSQNNEKSNTELELFELSLSQRCTARFNNSHSRPTTHGQCIKKIEKKSRKRKKKHKMNTLEQGVLYVIIYHIIIWVTPAFRGYIIDCAWAQGIRIKTLCFFLQLLGLHMLDVSYSFIYILLVGYAATVSTKFHVLWYILWNLTHHWVWS